MGILVCLGLSYDLWFSVKFLLLKSLSLCMLRSTYNQIVYISLAPSCRLQSIYFNATEVLFLEFQIVKSLHS